MQGAPVVLPPVCGAFVGLGTGSGDGIETIDWG